MEQLSDKMSRYSFVGYERMYVPEARSVTLSRINFNMEVYSEHYLL